MFRMISASAIAALLLAACSPETPAGDPATLERGTDESAGAVQPAGAETEATAEPLTPEELSFSTETETSTTSAEIDPAIAAFDPALARRLIAEAKLALDDLAANAAADKVDADKYAEGQGEESWFRLYSMDFTYRATAQVDDLISVEQQVSQYTGGAHPMHFIGGSVYRRGKAEPIGIGAIVADLPAFETKVVESLVDQKIERGYEETRPSLDASVREMIAPSADQTDVFTGRFVLEGSSEAGMFGGITVLYSPYDVGSYAEGVYIVTVPAADIAGLLAEDWAPLFGGTPVTGRETP